MRGILAFSSLFLTKEQGRKALEISDLLRSVTGDNALAVMKQAGSFVNEVNKKLEDTLDDAVKRLEEDFSESGENTARILQGITRLHSKNQLQQMKLIDQQKEELQALKTGKKTSPSEVAQLLDRHPLDRLRLVVGQWEATMQEAKRLVQES